MRTLLFLPALLCAVAAAPGSAQDDAPMPARQVQVLASELDALIAEELDGQGAVLHDIVDDETFLRRSYLQIVGRIPTLQEAKRFLDDDGQDKRARLVDGLLGSPGRTSHDLHFWLDLLRVKTRLAPQVSGEPYRARIREAIAKNEAYDAFVRALLTSEGAAHASDNGATGYFLRDRGMPEDNMANTMRIFLGTRIECAQCHDHPFDKWTQRQFFELAAFTGGLTYRQDLRGSEAGRKLQAMSESVRAAHGTEGVRAFRRSLRGVIAGISGTGTGVARMPKDSKSKSAKPGARLTAKAPFGTEVAIEVPPEPRRSKRRARNRKSGKRQRNRRMPEKEIDSRAAFADWLTSDENPRFALVIANRMWKRVMGRGLIEPVDDIKDDTRATLPKTMAFLERLMRALDYDLLTFRRVLLHSDFFQRAAASQSQDATAPTFNGPVSNRLTAEQLWDSMLTFVVDDVDATLGASGARSDRVAKMYDSFLAMDEAAVERRVQSELLRRKDPAAFRKKQRDQRAAQRRAATKRRKERQAKFRPLLRELGRAKRRGDAKAMASLRAKLKAEGYERPKPRQNRNLVRASELPSPAPDGHFLRQFGQSDREQIEASTTAPAVPQALTLLNGFVESQVLPRKSTALMRQVLSAEGVDARIETAFLAVLSRRPRAAEVELWREDVARGDDGCRDLLWTLTNLHEFRFLP